MQEYVARRALGAGLVLFAMAGGALSLWATTRDREVPAAEAGAGERHVQRMRAATGGVVEAILVADGAAIAAGDPVARMNDKEVRGDLVTIAQSVTALTARAARLQAERDGLQEISFPETLLKQPSLAPLLDGERETLAMRQSAESQQKDLLRRRIACFTDEIRAYDAQARSKAREAVLIQDQLKTTRDLRDKRLVPATRLIELEREALRLTGEENGWLAANIAQARAKIAEAELQLLQIDRERRRDVGKDMENVTAKLDELRRRALATEAVLQGSVIRAPLAGVVQRAGLRRPGDTVAAGEEILQIVARPSSRGALPVELVMQAPAWLGRMLRALSAAV
jgi:HlyD family secretion protein